VEFNGVAVRVMRRFLKLTQAELAELVAASETSIWKMERGQQPGDGLLEATAIALGVEPGFFFDQELAEFLEEECNFRKRLTAAERLRKWVLAHGALFGRVVAYLRGLLTLPPYRVPQLQAASLEDVERAAEKCREFYKLGKNAPIMSMGRVLENAGVVITYRDEQTALLDAFSRYGKTDSIHLVSLNKLNPKSASRARWDMAHELGHLVLHTSSKCSLKEKEKQAHRFAGAFLLPRDGFSSDFWAGGQGGVDWDHLFELKGRWKVSLQAMIYRAADLGLINALEFRRAYKEISIRRWRKEEPGEPPIENPELFAKAMRTLANKKGMAGSDVARALHLKPATFAGITGWDVTSQASDKESIRGVLPFPKKKATG